LKKKPDGEEGDVMAAVAFAEAGEWDTARRLSPGARPGRLAAWLERHLVAAALAEEGEHGEALRVMRPPAPVPPAPPPVVHALDALLAARGVRMLVGVAPAAALSARR
jgi:hypothetical protein